MNKTKIEWCTVGTPLLAVCTGALTAMQIGLQRGFQNMIRQIPQELRIEEEKHEAI